MDEGALHSNSTTVINVQYLIGSLKSKYTNTKFYTLLRPRGKRDFSANTKVACLHGAVKKEF